jgi:hypothetical protein
LTGRLYEGAILLRTVLIRRWRMLLFGVIGGDSDDNEG